MTVFRTESFDLAACKIDSLKHLLCCSKLKQSLRRGGAGEGLELMNETLFRGDVDGFLTKQFSFGQFCGNQSRK